ncbi:gamma-glutamyl-gamma-aminobutyrate hydrolase family protein, partial [Liquorilactobacillus vini]
MRIGITADINLTLTNSINLKLANFAPKPLLDVLIKNKVIPIIFPIASPKMAKELLETVDGIIIPGGPDVAPFLYQAEPILQNGATYQPRDEFELELIKQIQLAHKPLLGICRG